MVRPRWRVTLSRSRSNQWVADLWMLAFCLILLVQGGIRLTGLSSYSIASSIKAFATVYEPFFDVLVSFKKIMAKLFFIVKWCIPLKKGSQSIKEIDFKKKLNTTLILWMKLTGKLFSVCFLIRILYQKREKRAIPLFWCLYFQFN